MASKIKRLICLLAAAALLVASAPAASLYATTVDSETEPGSEAGASDGTSEKPDDGGPAVGKIPESEWITKKDYKKVAESDTYILYLYEPRLSIMLENKKTGKILESTLSDEKDDGTANATWTGYMKSGIVIYAIIKATNTYQVDLLNSKNELKYTYTDNGFSVDVYFEEYGFHLTVEVTLENDELLVHIPEESIVEDMVDQERYIYTISLFPFMGYSYMDEQDGYMLVPDGNGALIYLDDKEGRYNSGFSQLIYGKDEGFESQKVETLLWERYQTVTDVNRIIAPVFGMAHTEEQQAYLGIVEKGDTRASIEVHPNGVSVNYNRCFARFLLRDVFTQPLNNSNSGSVQSPERDRTHTDLQVRYILLSGEDADYSGMAVAYRNYLLDNGLVTAKETDYSTRVDFLGTDREEFLIGTKAVTMTTTDNIKEVYADLQDWGVKSVLTVYKGWQKGGLYNLPIKKYKADGEIGGTSALTDLIKKSAEQDYNIYLYNDGLRMNASTNMMTYNAVKMVNKRTLKEENYAQVYDTFYYLMPGKTDATLDKFAKSYSKKGVDNLALAGISNSLFSYSSKGNFYGRQDCADSYGETIAELDENMNLILEQPIACYWNNTDAFLDMPLGSSDYMYLDEEVPFLSIVLKGIIPMYSEYVNFEANKTEFFLQMVESGVYPSFYLTYENSSALIYTNSSDLYSTEYRIYKDTVVEYDKALRKVASAVDGAYIVEHDKLDNNVTKVVYDNGVVIYVNYSDSAVTVDGISIDALSYKVGEAK